MATRAKLSSSQRTTDTSARKGPSKKRSRLQSERDNISSHAAAPGQSIRSSSESSSIGEWDDDIHRNFVAAVFEIGMRNSSPAVILENMIERPNAITSERVKSKLQKFRNSKDKALQDFMDEYDAFLGKLQAVGPAGMGNQQDSISAILQMMGRRKLVGGDAAAMVSYLAISEDSMSAGASAPAAGLRSQTTGKSGAATHFLRKDAIEYVEDFAGAGIPFPMLSDEERKSSLGLSMLHVKELFQSTRHHVLTSRDIAKGD